MNCRTLKFTLILLIFLSIPRMVLALSHDGFLRLYHSHLDEYLEIQYEKGGRLIPEALDKINYLMRSRDNGEVKAIDPDLIRLMDHLQDHFKADTVEVICGYRRPEYNQKLKDTGHN